MDVERLRGAEPVRVPDLVDQPLARDDGAGVLHQQPQEVELLAAELELRAAERRTAAVGVEPNLSDTDGAVRPPLAGLRRPPEHRPPPRHELARAERPHD